jgi:5'-nucleotidase
LRAVYYERGFFESLTPITGALDALRAMRDTGLDVVICTSPSISSPWCESEKRHWVMDHLGEAYARRMVITKDKTLIRGNLLIDDRPVVTGSLPPSWKHIIFDAPYNRDVAGLRIVADWSNWQQVLQIA